MTVSDITNGSPLNVLEALKSGEPRDLRTLQGKLTLVGSQKKSVPSLVFTTFHHIARMDWFPPTKAGGPNYVGNDSIAWHFTTTPEEVKAIVSSLAALGEVFRRSESPPSPHLSLAMALRASRLGDLAFEAALDAGDSKAVFDAIRGSLDQTNGLARTVMGLHRQSVFGPQ
jgi:hypothetical protein